MLQIVRLDGFHQHSDDDQNLGIKILTCCFEKNKSPIIKIDSCWKRRNPANPRNIMIGDSLLPKVFLVLVLFIVLSDGKA